MMPRRLHTLAGLALLVLTLLACALLPAAPIPAPTPDFTAPLPASPTGIVTPPTAVPTPLPAATSTSETAPPAPTATHWRDQIGYDEAAQAYRIRFSPGATSIDINATTTIGTLTADGGKRYVLSAMQGQVMSVAVLESWPFSVEVATKDGPLSSVDNARPFWRGLLPANGDYYVTVKTQTPGDFSLRIAINPPGQASQFFEYTNLDPSLSGFSLRYSDEFAPSAYIPVGGYAGTPFFVLQYINSESYWPVTNLSEGFFMVNAIADTANCTQINAPNETLLGQKTINGYEFTQSQVIGLAAGNIYDQIIHRSVIKETCYEIVFFIHSSNIGVFAPGTVVEFDRAALLQKFEEVLSTFTVK